MKVGDYVRVEDGGIQGVDIWEFDEHYQDYKNGADEMLLYSGMTSNHLNDTVEIIEDKIEKLNTDRIFNRKYLCDDISIDFLKADIMGISDKINEIIDKVNNTE